MQNKKILKKIKHQRYKDQQFADLILQRKDPLLWQQKAVFRASDKGSFWQMPVTTRSFYDSGEYTKDFEKCSAGLNEVRNTLIGTTLSWYKNETIAKRNNLEKYYEEQKPVYWEASLSNLAAKNKYNVNILLDRPVLIDPSSGLQIAFRMSGVELLDYHMWLPVRNLISLPNNKQEFAQGDALRGVSLIKKYNSKGQTKYGLGRTVIFDAGVAIESYHSMNAAGWQSVNGLILSDYDRFDEQLLSLENQDINLATLENAEDLLNNHRPKYSIKFNLDNQIDYTKRYTEDKYHSDLF